LDDFDESLDDFEEPLDDFEEPLDGFDESSAHDEVLLRTPGLDKIST
jgi:hypothetical protein